MLKFKTSPSTCEDTQGQKGTSWRVQLGRVVALTPKGAGGLPNPFQSQKMKRKPLGGSDLLGWSREAKEEIPLHLTQLGVQPDLQQGTRPPTAVQEGALGCYNSQC